MSSIFHNYSTASRNTSTNDCKYDPRAAGRAQVLDSAPAQLSGVLGPCKPQARVSRRQGVDGSTGTLGPWPHPALLRPCREGRPRELNQRARQAAILSGGTRLAALLGVRDAWMDGCLFFSAPILWYFVMENSERTESREASARSSMHSALASVLPREGQEPPTRLQQRLGGQGGGRDSPLTDSHDV